VPSILQCFHYSIPRIRRHKDARRMLFTDTASDTQNDFMKPQRYFPSVDNRIPPIIAKQVGIHNSSHVSKNITASGSLITPQLRQSSSRYPGTNSIQPMSMVKINLPKGPVAVEISHQSRAFSASNQAQNDSLNAQGVLLKDKFHGL
jgi:hypothetical protein